MPASFGGYQVRDSKHPVRVDEHAEDLVDLPDNRYLDLLHPGHFSARQRPMPMSRPMNVPHEQDLPTPVAHDCTTGEMRPRKGVSRPFRVCWNRSGIGQDHSPFTCA
jgi:hypothetical protein